MTDGNDFLAGFIRNEGNALPNTPLTKREYFAAMAMQAIIAADDAVTICNLAKNLGVRPPETVALVAVEHADALIDVLNQESK